jgi:hypothetical protein
MKKFAALSILAVPALLMACGERVPSELRPGFDEMTNLPFNLCTEEGQGPASLLLRNIGDDEVTISGVAFVAVTGKEAELLSFDEPTLDVDSLLADETAFVQFDYRVPGGLAQHATLVITSDAAVNPKLEVPVTTLELVPETPPTCAEGEGEGET